MNSPNMVFSKAFQKMDITERLERVKPGHGPYKMAQDALKEIVAQRYRATMTERRANELAEENAGLKKEIEALRTLNARLRLEAAQAA